MTCHEFEEQANLYIDGLLDEEAACRVEEHMAACPECKKMYEQLIQVVEALGSLEDLPLPEGFEDALAAKLTPAPKKRSLWRHPGLWTGVAAVLMVMVVGLAGMGGQAKRMINANTSADGAAGAVEMFTMAETKAAAMNSFEMMDMEMSMEAEEEGPVSAGNGVSRSMEKPSAVMEEKLVYTADVQMRSYSFDEDYAALKDKVQALNGYIDRNYVEGLPYSQSGGNGRYGSLQLRVPQQSYSELMDWLKELGEITSTQETVSNITLQYTETKIRMENLEKQITRLQELLEKAESIEDIIALETQLTNVTSELEYVTGQLNSMDHDVNYSTVNVSLQEMRTSSDPLPTQQRSFGQRMADAFGEGWLNFVSGLEGFALNIVMAIPTLAVIAVLIVIVVIVIQVIRKKKK